ncbi:hypothetical protein CONPUDRAFT_157630 [Coniophora puteana RWD-64-598 SS2]|uniref:Anaphase-promoting complex subunit 4-like WD40 domain-containing protein n=1 Tax=Coniophora puteana (strain RWD-64-598) TaxID=741705 RepID=A0A5M3ME97_CONPW|nr:uncharacterized protein CONPUDRAFT_157630 [Coniophora puteana RWD-64-598 SS2]EIW77377.1 hypothetical protein CONPUDRAFT_157630 [Coniophora puteana RWD-64-598 SS2]
MSSATHSTPDTLSDADDAPRPFAGHTKRITAIEYSPDGHLLVTASKDATVRLWDPLTGQQLQKLDTPSGAKCLVFHPTGRQLAAICKNNPTVLVWDIKEDELGMLRNITSKRTYDVGGSTSPECVRFSNNGKLLAVMTYQSVALLDAESGHLLINAIEVTRQFRLMNLLAFSPGGRSVLFAYYGLLRPSTMHSSTPTVYSFDLSTRQQERVNLSTDLSHQPWPMVISYNGTMIAGFAPHGIQIWKVDGGEVLHGPLRGHLWGTSIICFSLDDEWLIDVSKANTVCVWDTSTGKSALGPLRQPPSRNAHITAVTCSLLKDRIACADESGNIHVWDTDTKQVVLSSLPDRKQIQPLVTPGRFEVDSVHWFPDGRYFVSSSMCDDYIRTWDAENGEQVREYLVPGGSCIALSPDGTLLVAGCATYFGSVKLFDTKTGNEYQHPLDIHGRAYRRVKFSPDGSALAIVLDDAHDSNLCLIFNVLSDHKTMFVEHPSTVVDVAFSPHGEQFAYLTASDGILICNTSSLDMVSKDSYTVSGVIDRFHSISFSPDGRSLLICSGELLVLDLHTRQTILRLDANNMDIQAVFSPDGRTLLYSMHGTSIQSVDAATGDTVWRSEVSYVTTLSFSPGGERIAIGLRNGDIKLYEATSGRMLLPKRDMSSEANLSDEEPIDAAGDQHISRPGPSRRGISLAVADDDSIMNMPAVRKSSAPRPDSPSTRQRNSRAKDGSGREPRRGFLTRLTSRRGSDPLASNEPSNDRRRMLRMLELVSVGRANLTISLYRMLSDAPSAPDADDGPRPFAGHTKRIAAIEYSPDGRLIATASEDATVRLWDPLTGQQLQKLDTPSGAVSLAFHPTGRQLATICKNDSTVLVWDLKEDELGVMQNITVKKTYDAEPYTHPHSVRFSNNGKLLAVMTVWSLALRDAETGQLIMHIIEVTQPFRLMDMLAFSADDRSVFFAYYDLPTPGTTHLGTPAVCSFDLATKQQGPINLSTDPSHYPQPLTVSYDGTMIAGDAPHGLQIWKVDGGEVLHGPFRGHILGTRLRCFSRDGEWLIDVSKASTVSIWDTSTGNLVLGPLRQPPNLGIESMHCITAATCSPLKDRIVCADGSGSIHVWNVDTQQVVLSSLPVRKRVRPLTIPGCFEVDGVQWFPDGRYFISSSMCDDYIHMWDAETGEQVRKYLFPGGSCIALSPDGTVLAAGSAFYAESIAFFDTETGKEHSHSLDGPVRASRKMKFSPNGSTLAIVLDGGHDSNLCFIYNVIGDRKTMFVQHPSTVLDVAFSPDGEQYAYITTDDGILLSSTLSLEFISKISSMTSDVSGPTHSISFSPDGQRLLICSRGLLVLDLHTCQTILHLYVGFGHVHAAFSPDGRSLLYSVRGYPMQMVNAATDDPIWQYNVSNLTCFAFSPGGEIIAVGSEYGVFKLYEAATGHMILPKGDNTSSDGGSSSDEPLNMAAHDSRQGPSGRGLTLADADDDSLMNMPAAIRRSAPGGSNARQTPRKNSGGKDVSDGEPRRGLIARLTSRRNSDGPTSDEPNNDRRRMSRMFELVSVGRANLRVMAAGPSEQGRLSDRRREGESDESSSSPSPPASTRPRVESPEAGIDDQRSITPSSDGLRDILCYCLCIPRCHKD